MSVIKCPECDREVSDRATACPQCGFPVSAIDIENARLPLVEEAAPAAVAPSTVESRASDTAQGSELDATAAPAAVPQVPSVIPCENCALPIPAGRDACPNCGAPTPSPNDAIGGLPDSTNQTESMPYGLQGIDEKQRLQELRRRFGIWPNLLQGLFGLGVGLGGVSDLVRVADAWSSSTSANALGRLPLISVPVALRAMIGIVAAVAVLGGMRLAGRLAVLAALAGIVLTAPLMLTGRAVQGPASVFLFWSVVWLLYFRFSKAVRAEYGPVTIQGALNLLVGRA